MDDEDVKLQFGSVIDAELQASVDGRADVEVMIRVIQEGGVGTVRCR